MASPLLPRQEPETRSEEDTAMLYCAVAGSRHAIGKVLPSKVFRAGDCLDLQRESKNAEDTFAVRVMHNDKKIGYLPKPHSVAIARQLDGGDALNGNDRHYKRLNFQRTYSYLLGRKNASRSLILWLIQ